MFQQLVYISSVSPRTTVSVSQIVHVSQTNNRRDGLTGLLFYNGKRFLQALEGDEAAIFTTMNRIRADPRHRAVVILSERTVPEREFGLWSMTDATLAADADRYLASIQRMTANAAPSVRSTFASFAEISAA